MKYGYIWQFDYASQLTRPKQPRKHTASYLDIPVFPFPRDQVPLMHSRKVLIRVDDILLGKVPPVGKDQAPAELQLCSPLILLCRGGYFSGMLDEVTSSAGWNFIQCCIGFHPVLDGVSWSAGWGSIQC